MSPVPPVLPLFGLPLRDRHRRVADLRRVVPVAVEIDVLEPLVVVALGIVGAELRAARLLALDGGDDDRLGAVEHVPELDRAEHVLVEDRPAVVDVGGLLLLLQAEHDPQRLAQPGLVAEDGDVTVHRRAQLVLDLGDPAAAVALAGDDRPIVRSSSWRPARPASGIGMWGERFAACLPARAPKISVSRSEFAPRRLPP